MKVGALTLMIGLLLAWPALAGTPDPCAGSPDTDADTVCDAIDNCDALANPTQLDSDGDGFGNRCDCDFDQDFDGDGTDFLTFGACYNILSPVFPATVPPANPNCDMDGDLDVDGTDFLAFGACYNFLSPVFPGVPGTSCGNAPGVPCP